MNEDWQILSEHESNAMKSGFSELEVLAPVGAELTGAGFFKVETEHRPDKYE